MSEKRILWQPQPDNAMQKFREFVNQKMGADFRNYQELYAFSVSHSEDFWRLFVEYIALPLRKPPLQILERHTPWRKSRWFVGAEINWAEIALESRRNSDQLAAISYDENGLRAELSYRKLYARVSAFAATLKAQGLKPGDHFAVFMPNTEETLVALLAAVSAGAVFSSTSPDFGVVAACDRLQQFAPRFLCATTHYFFKGKKISLREKLEAIVRNLPTLECVLLFRPDQESLNALSQANPKLRVVAISGHEEKTTPIEFHPYTFQDALYVMYSSGTTGLPKGIVQGHGVIVNHMKEHQLHCGITPDDVVFYYTTCGWMMYHWLVSALCSGATIVFYDGSPFYPENSVLWQMANACGITVFGTSARYLTTLAQENFDARQWTQNSRIRTILSTGSVLPPEGFRYVYAHIHPQVQLCSISGGTDLNGCWALGNPDLPVIEGELQCRGLGMAVEVWNDQGKSVVGEMGELVATAPFPSMPLGFLNDPDGERYRKSYFDRFTGRDVWAHGDFAMLTESGGMVLAGRSDATLNPGGVRIGTAEIYRVLEGIPEIEDSLVIGLPKASDEVIVLFVKLRSGNLTQELEQKIRQKLRSEASPRHVPAYILQVSAIPYTLNGKKVELAVKYLALGRPVTNRETLANGEVLSEYEKLLQKLAVGQ